MKPQSEELRGVVPLCGVRPFSLMNAIDGFVLCSVIHRFFLSVV